MVVVGLSVVVVVVTSSVVVVVVIGHVISLIVTNTPLLSVIYHANLSNSKVPSISFHGHDNHTPSFNGV